MGDPMIGRRNEVAEPSDAMCDAAEAASKEVPRSTVSLREWWRIVLRAAYAVDANAVAAPREQNPDHSGEMSAIEDAVRDALAEYGPNCSPYSITELAHVVTPFLWNTGIRKPLQTDAVQIEALLRAGWRVLAAWDGLDIAHAPNTGDAEADIGPYRDRMDDALNELRTAMEPLGHLLGEPGA